MEYGVKIVPVGETVDVKLTDALADQRDIITGTRGPRTSASHRSKDEMEALSVANNLAALRNLHGLGEVVTFHRCRHDEGINDCASVVIRL